MKKIIVRGSAVEVILKNEWDILTHEQKEQNAKRHNSQTFGDNACRLCGQKMSDKVISKAWFVHMTVDGDLFPVAIELSDSEGSQGFFPIGSSCAKKIPIDFRRKF